MKYKLYTEQKYSSPTEQILKGRGIDNIDEWLNSSEKDISNWDKLKNIEEAVKVLYSSINNNLKTSIIVDCDVDGYTSSAILINFLNSLYPEWTNEYVSYHHHSGKQHGLTDMRDIIPEGTKLIICPDSASNDYEEHAYWETKNVDIIILDHHEAPEVSPHKNVITVNNQLCDYLNKDFSGAGIVWQFCRAFNDIYKVKGDLSTDLCALGTCGDMMSYKSVETKALVDLGFSKITNPLFYTLVDKNSYIVNKHGGVGYKGIAFGVVPFINATVRSGTDVEKDLVFRAMCKPWCFEKTASSNRLKKGKDVPIYEEAAHLTSSIKKRQDDGVKDAIELINYKIKNDNLLQNNVLLVACDEEEIESNMRGLVANKIASKYQRPCFILSKVEDEDGVHYRGSMRNYSMSEIKNFKDIIEDTGLAEYVQGHQGAAGCGVLEENIEGLVSKLNDVYSDVPKEPVYWVDYVWRSSEAEPNKMLEIANMWKFWGQDVPSSQVCVVDIPLNNCKITMCGKKGDALRMVLPNGLVLCKFGFDEDVFNEMLEEDMYMTAILTPSKNEWQGKISGEGFIDDFFIEKKWVF